MMRDCDFYEIHLADYAADDLAAGEREMLEEHLESCPDCRAELARETDLRRLLGNLPAAACPDAVSRSLHGLLDLDAPPAAAGHLRRTRTWFAPAGVVAAALLVVLLAPTLRDTAPPTADAPYSEAEIAQARREVIAVLALTADVLDRSSGRTMTDVFGDRLPEAVSGSLRSPHDPDAHTPHSAPSASDNGGQG